MREFSFWANRHLIADEETESVDSHLPRLRPTDENLQGFDELLSDWPEPVMALYADAGSSIRSITKIHATWRPGRSLTMRYRIRAGDGPLNGSHDLLASVGDPGQGALVVKGPGADISVWVLPDDPRLPGLRSALHVPTVQALLRDLGAEGDVAFSRMRSYRPGRRAVVQVEAGGSSIFLKVVPPAEVEELHRKHRHLAGHLPIPDSLGLAPELGIVVLHSVSGVELRRALRDGAHPIPAARAIAGFVAKLPKPAPEWRSKSSLEMLPGVSALLTRLVPEARERIEGLVSEIGPETGSVTVPVHGDFHEGQVLIDGSHPVGLLDVDTYGWGRPGADAATMLGHLHLLAPGCRGDAIGLARGLNRHWDAIFDPVALRLNIASTVLGLATGPFRVQSSRWRAETLARIEVAEQWVRSAHRVDEKNLIATSGGSHDRLR
ncbi:MAG TPA: aminoglycoside phosphotransferase family protein [Acidimicrobiia bacterium]